jgi:hypothetical protein
MGIEPTYQILAGTLDLKTVQSKNMSVP